MNTEKTIHLHGIREFIYVWPNDGAKNSKSVVRLPPSKRKRCKYVWKPIAARGHGKWNSGCSKCGALSR